MHNLLSAVTQSGIDKRKMTHNFFIEASITREILRFI